MLSICIPVYNYDCRQLITDLSRQIHPDSPATEIVVIDDGSDISYKSLYEDVQSEIIRYISLPKNIGRAKVRNLFIEYTRYEYLLFLDSDDKIVSDFFLKNYFNEIHSESEVVGGGIIYQNERPDPDRILHWHYEKTMESRLVERRKSKSYEAFISNNFLIRKSIFSRIRFDSRLSEYGHEDTLFGYSLFKSGYCLKYINNPVLHEYLNSNTIFLKKVELAVKNLVKIINEQNDKDFVKSIYLSKVYFRMKKTGLIYGLYPFENIISQYCYKKLVNANASTRCLNLYKLCLFSKYYRSRK